MSLFEDILHRHHKKDVVRILQAMQKKKAFHHDKIIDF